MLKIHQSFTLFLFIFALCLLPTYVIGQVPLGKMTAFWRTCMMTGGKDQIVPWHMYKNPVAYLDQSDFPYNYAKYGYSPDDVFALHADNAAYVRFLSSGKNDRYDLAERVDGQVVVKAEEVRKRFAKTESAGTISNYIIVLDNIPFCFPKPENVKVETYGQTALPADMDEWSKFIVDLCCVIRNTLGEKKANDLIFRMGTEAHDGGRYKYNDPQVMLDFYKLTARAVKTILPDARFGPYNTHTPWKPKTQVLKMPDLVRFCMNNDLTLDFIGYSWYVQGSSALTDSSGFIDHWKQAVALNSELENIPKEYQEFGSLGLAGNKYVRPSSDNAAAIFNMLMNSRAGGLTGTYHWPVDVKISDRPATYVLNALGWVFQVLDHTTGGDSYLLDAVADNSDYGSQIRALGVFGCENNNSYMIISSFNTDIDKADRETVQIRIPKSIIDMRLDNDYFREATLDRDNCPLLAIRNDLESAGYVTSEYMTKPNVTLYFPVHYVLAGGSITDISQARKLISHNRQKYTDLCCDSLTYRQKSVSMSENSSEYIAKISVRANSITVIQLNQ